MAGKGIFISFEGIDGAGKTTLIQNLSERFAREKRLTQIVREPGGTEISEMIRAMLLDEKNIKMSAKTEALLYSAARVQLVEEVIKPLLVKGYLVFADRYIDSTIAYQGCGRGLDLEFLHLLNHHAAYGVIPTRTFLIDLDPEIAATRRKKENTDRLEKIGIPFQEKVRAGYLCLAQTNPERIKVIDGRQNPAALESQVAAMIMEIMPYSANIMRNV